MRKVICLFMCLASLLAFSGCGENDKKPDSNMPPTIEDEPNQGEQEKPTEKVDYGEVTFNNVKVFEGFDGVEIKYDFTKPEACKNEVFEYEIANEKICYIEDDKVYYLSNGSTRVKAKSTNLSASFTVKCSNDTSKFKTQSNQQITRLKSNFKENDTLFLGDSFFEFWRNKQGITENFDTAFSGLAVYNIGISATTTHHWRAINTKLEELEIKPKNVVINIGINNVDDDMETSKECSNAIKDLIEDYLKMFPEANIYYLSITRCAGYFAFNWESHEKSNAIMKDYCDNTDRVHYLDIMGLYGDDYANYQQDGLHPNQAGYNLFKQIIKENVPINKK